MKKLSVSGIFKILSGSIFFIFIFLTISCGSTKKIADKKVLPKDSEKGISLGKTQDFKKNYFSRIDSKILSDVEMGTPQSLKRAAANLRKGEIEQEESEKVLLSVITNILKIVWPEEYIEWEEPHPASETPYTGAITSAQNGLYDLSTGNVDFLTNLLPSLVVFKVSNVTSFYYQAQKDLETALSLNSNSFLAYYILSLLNFKSKKYEKALENLDKANKILPNLKQIIELYAKTYKSSGKIKESYDFAQKNLKLFPKNVELLKLCAENSYDLKLYDQAETYIAQVLLQNPNDLEALLFRAKILINSKNYIRAVSLLDMYSKQDENAKDYLLLRSQVQFEWSKNTNEAISTIEKALKLYPNDFEILLYAARLANESYSKISGKTVDYYSEKILSIEPENISALKYAVNGYIQQKNFSKAYNLSKKLISKTKNNSEDILNFCNICIELNRYDEAFQFISPLFKQNPNDENLIQSYISVIIAQKKNSEVQDLISKYLSNSSVKLKSFLYYKKSFLATSQEQELSDLRNSLISNPRNIDSLFRLYQIYFAKKDFRKAQYYLKQIVALNPNDNQYKKLNEELNSLLK